MNPKHNEGLFSAVIQGNFKQIQTLLDDGASINATSYCNNWSPLHLAAVLNRTDLIEKLIKGNADVNLVDTNGKTALHLALSHGHRLAAELLKQDGSSLQVRNDKGETPVEEIFDDQRRKRRKDDSSEGDILVEEHFRDQSHRNDLFSEGLFRAVIQENAKEVQKLDDGASINSTSFSKGEIPIEEHFRDQSSRNDSFSETKRPLDLSNLTDLIECKREMKLDVDKDLKIGMEVAVGKMRLCRRKEYIYKHHGIITSINDITKNFEIVELTASGTSVNIFPALSRCHLEPKVVKSCIKFTTKNLFYYEYKNSYFEHNTIKERADILFPLFESCGVKYQLYEFNCEHFASYCATGVAFSRQVRHVNKDATITLDRRLKWFMDRKLTNNRSNLNNTPEVSTKIG